MSAEKKRPEKLKPAGGPGDGSSLFDAKPDADDKMVTVSSGVYADKVPVAGMSVAEVRRRFADRFQIDKQSTPVVSANPVDEDYILKTGEGLQFIKHAGEKGNPSITIEGNVASTTSPEGQTKTMPVKTLMERASIQADTGPFVMPSGGKAIISRGNITLLVWEQAPTIQLLKWISEDSPSEYGSGTKYRNVRIALPYLYIISTYTMDGGLPSLSVGMNECFFRNDPLKSLDDELHFPALLNCSKYGNADNPSYPLSWICTQHLRQTSEMGSKDPNVRFIGGFKAVRHCLLETGFNRSSEHHEGNSWFNASRTVDKRIATVKAWEDATLKDPMFATEVKWIPTHHSVKDFAERQFKRCNATERAVKNSNDLYRVIMNG